LPLDVFLFFLCFLLFVGYEVWFVVLHGVLAPRSRIGDGALLPRFSFMLEMRMVQNGWRGILVVKEDKFQKTQEAKHAFESDSLWDFVFLNLLCEFWEECLSSIMCKFCPLTS
jgi:hypothetical protein